jgi:hypothetical protein
MTASQQKINLKESKTPHRAVKDTPKTGILGSFPSPFGLLQRLLRPHLFTASSVGTACASPRSSHPKRPEPQPRGERAAPCGRKPAARSRLQPGEWLFSLCAVPARAPAPAAGRAAGGGKGASFFFQPRTGLSRRQFSSMLIVVKNTGGEISGVHFLRSNSKECFEQHSAKSE